MAKFIVPEIIYRVFTLKHNNAARVNYSKPAARNRVFTSEIDGLFAALADNPFFTTAISENGISLFCFIAG